MLPSSKLPKVLPTTRRLTKPKAIQLSKKPLNLAAFLLVVLCVLLIKESISWCPWSCVLPNHGVLAAHRPARNAAQLAL